MAARMFVRGWYAWVLLLAAPAAWGQVEVRADERLAPDRPEAWAMQRAAVSTLMTGFGPPPQLQPGNWRLALDLGHAPRLDANEQTVGFNGSKREDLNKSPVFGRLRWQVGLSAGWVGELGYTPPLHVDGAHAQDLVAFALSHRLHTRDAMTLSARLFGEHGGVRGDITCPRALARVDDPARNPYGCQAASDDHAILDHYGLGVVAGWNRGDWRWHVEAGAVRTELEVRVDALTFDVRDRSHLAARDVLPYAAMGAGHALGAHWDGVVEVLYVPLKVRRDPEGHLANEPLVSLRLQLGWRP